MQSQTQVRIIKAQAKNSNIITQSQKQRVAAYCRVSTDVEEQLSSFESQKEYYKRKISENPEWEFVDIYADEAVTGTKVSSREGFQKMINDCMEGKIDIVMTKSISRFARNTVDTLNYVRKLKEKNIAVIFEEEHINTLAMEGELLLTILSSVAQQEVANTSAHVKKGFKMKLERGELIGFNGCYGYDYDIETKSLHINEEAAKVVRYIFQRYAEGYGASVICKELEAMHVKTYRGNDKWSTTVITGIIRNEKYIGNCVFGKTYTVDPIEKKRVTNKGQMDMVVLENNHEPIVSREIFDKANKYLEYRSKGKKQFIVGEFLDFKGKYTFSRKIRCGFCGGVYTRRSHQQTTSKFKPTWKCLTTTKEGAIYCPESTIVDEKNIEDAFVMLMQRLIKADDKLVGKFIDSTQSSLEKTKPAKSIENTKTAIKALEVRKSQLMDLMLDGTITKEQFQEKTIGVDKRIAEYQNDILETEKILQKQKSFEYKLLEIKSLMQEDTKIEVFEPDAFEALIKTVIVGGKDEEGNVDSHMLTFIFAGDRTNLGEKMKYLVFDTFQMPVHLYEFVKTDCGANRRKVIDSINVRIAIETK